MRCNGNLLRLGLASLCLLHGNLFAAEPIWDCRVGADGKSWVCAKDGQPVEDRTTPDAPTATVTRPLAEPAPAKATALPPSTTTSAETAPSSNKTQFKKTVEPPKTEPITDTDTKKPASDISPSQQPKAQDKVEKRAARTTEPPARTTTTETDKEALRTEPEMPNLAAPPHREPSATPEPHATKTHSTTPAPATETGSVTDAHQERADKPLATAGSAVTGGIDAGIDWMSCGITQPNDRAGDNTPIDDATAPVLVSADAAVAELDPETAVFSGNVTLIQGTMRLDAAEVRLNRRTGEAEAMGGFVLNRPDIRVAGTNARYLLSSEQGQIDQASYRVPSARARGDAAHAELLDDGQSRYRDINYSTCRPGEDDWLLSAETLELDRVEGRGLAHHATLRFMGVPLLYSPVFSFPIDDRRRSGLLVPSVGSSSNTGFDLSVPYYFNLAPNYDFTFTPRLMAKRGLLLGGEFRFLTEDSDGTVIAELLPDDSEYDEGDQRGSLSITANKRFNARTTANVRLNYVSDRDYLSDLGNSLAATSTVFAERTGDLRYYGDTWDLIARAQYYQTIDDSIAPANRPYGRLPQLQIDLENPDGIASTTYHLDAEYVNFYRRDALRGHRFDLFPAISLPLEHDWAYLEPKIGARYTAYRLSNQTADLSDSPSTLNGLFSLDGGLFFDRNTSYFDIAATQTLEPRFYYLFVPDKNQDDQPVFDTGALNFSFDNLFRENRFNGPDRFGDANQLVLALTSRVLSSTTGAELLRASIGQTLFFEDRGVTLPGETVADDSTSALAGEVAATLGRGWRTRAGLEWNPHEGSNGKIEQALAQLSYRDNNQRLLNAAYRLRDGIIKQTDLAAIWPLNEQFTLIGRHNYSLEDSRLLEALAGVEYGQCCWRIRAMVRKHTDGAGEDHNLAFLIQLELNGLGRLGDDIDQTLRRGIYGYRTND